MEALLQELGILGSFQNFILILGLIMGRLVPILMQNPVLGGKLMPQNLKIGFCVLIAILVYRPLNESLTQPIPQTALPYILLLLKEVLIGLAIGFISSLVFYGIQTAGRIVDLARGANMADMIAPQMEAHVSFVGELQFQFSIVLFFLVNGHHFFLRAIFKSFEVMPLDRFPDFARMSGVAINLLAWTSGQVFAIGLLLAAPPLLACFMTDVVFGIINRVAPQINSFFMSMPVKGAVGLIVLFFIFGFLTDRMKIYFVEMLRSVNYLIHLL